MGNIRRLKKQMRMAQNKGYKVPILHTMPDGKIKIIGKKSILNLCKFSVTKTEPVKVEDHIE